MGPDTSIVAVRSAKWNRSSMLPDWDRAAGTSGLAKDYVVGKDNPDPTVCRRPVRIEQKAAGPAICPNPAVDALVSRSPNPVSRRRPNASFALRLARRFTSEGSRSTMRDVWASHPHVEATGRSGVSSGRCVWAPRASPHQARKPRSRLNSICIRMFRWVPSPRVKSIRTTGVSGTTSTLRSGKSSA